MTDENPRAKISRRKVLLWTGAGVALASPLAYRLATSFLGSRRDPNVYQLSFTGPFAPDQPLFEETLGNEWIDLAPLGFVVWRNEVFLSPVYRCKGPQDPDRGVHVRIAVTTTHGETHTVLDRDEPYTAAMSNAVGGSSGGPVVLMEVLAVPVRLSDITGLEIQFRRGVKL